MTTLNTLIEAYVASHQVDAAAMTRLEFWTQAFGTKALTDITQDDVDAALVRLAERGRLIPRRGKASQPLSGSTLNRFISQLAGLFRYAKRLRLLPRASVPPTSGFEKAPEVVDPDKYLRPEEVERLVKIPQSRNCLKRRKSLARGAALGLRWMDSPWVPRDQPSASLSV